MSIRQAVPSAEFDTLFARALNAIRHGRLGDALAAAAVLSQRYADEPAVRQLNATIALSAGDPAAARRHIAQSLAVRADHLPSLLLAGRAAFADNAFDEAAAMFERAIGVSAGSAEAWFGLGNARVALLKYYEGEQALARSVELDPAAREPRYNRALALRHKGEHEAAARELTTLTERHPAFAGGWLALGLALHDLRDFAGAQAAYAHAIEADGTSVAARVNLGVVLLETGERDAAMRAFASAYRLAPSSFGRIALALTSAPCGRLSLDLAALRRELAV